MAQLPNFVLVISLYFVPFCVYLAKAGSESRALQPWARLGRWTMLPVFRRFVACPGRDGPAGFRMAGSTSCLPMQARHGERGGSSSWDLGAVE